MKKILINLNVLFSTFILLLILGEITARIIIFFKNKNGFEKIMQSLPIIKDDEDVGSGLGKIIQPSKYSEIIYELRPHMKINFENVLVKTNNQGWRCKDYSLEKRENVVRIIGLGDSFMFGHGVEQEETSLSFLENKLNQEFSTKKWEVINTAVPGYNTAMEIETLEKKALAYKPDIVIIEFIGNDFNLPNFIYESSDCLNIKKSFFIDFLFNRFNLAKKNFKLYPAPRSSHEPWRFEDDPQKVPQQFRDMVGWKGFTMAMEKLKKIQERNNFDVIILITDNYLNNKVVELSKRFGFHTILNFINYKDKSLILSEKDTHPSVLQNRKTAENILNYMVEQGIIQKYVNNLNKTP